MDKKYWCELSSEERCRIDDEWKHSDWFAHAVNYRSYNNAHSVGFCLYLIVAFYCTLQAFMYFVSSATGENELWIGIGVVYCVLALIFYILTGVENTRSENSYIEKEKERWLLKNHNIIK